MKPGNKLRLAFGDIEGRPVGLGNTGDKIDAEQRQQRQPEPVDQTAVLGTDDVAKIQAASGHQYPHQGKTHGDLIGNDLGG